MLRLWALIVALAFAGLQTVWADAEPLSSAEVESLIKGHTRASYYSGGTYYITFGASGSRCVRLGRKTGACWWEGPWWLEKSSVCRKSKKKGEYCWTVTPLSDGKYQSEIVRVNDSPHPIGKKSEFWMAEE